MVILDPEKTYDTWPMDLRGGISNAFFIPYHHWYRQSEAHIRTEHANGTSETVRRQGMVGVCRVLPSVADVVGGFRPYSFQSLNSCGDGEHQATQKSAHLIAVIKHYRCGTCESALERAGVSLQQKGMWVKYHGVLQWHVRGCDLMDDR